MARAFLNVEVKGSDGAWYQVPTGELGEERLNSMPESMARTKNNGENLQAWMVAQDLIKHRQVLPIEVRLTVSIEGERSTRSLSL